jgi:16S rRNA processing protein RimM
VPRDRLPSLPDDEFYHADLIGLSAYDTGGELIGKVTAIYNHGAGDIVEISPIRHKSALLLPFTTAIVPNVDLAERRVIVNLPDEAEE